MLLDVSRLILYSLPLIDPPSVKHSLSLPLSKQLCIIFLFSHSVSLVDGHDRKASGHAASIFWDTSHSHLLSISSHHRLKDATETIHNSESQPDARRPNIPSSNIGGEGRSKMPRPIFAGIFLSTALSSDKWPFYPPLFLFLPTTHQCGRRERGRRKGRVLKPSDHFAQLPISHHPSAIRSLLLVVWESRGVKEGRE